MKRFVSAVSLCVFLLLFGLLVFLPPANAEKNLLENLLDLPAPPPPNPLVVSNRKNRPANFLNRNKTPDEDAPIEDLLAYWQFINQYNRKTSYAPIPSERTFDRLRAEIESKPELLPSLMNALPDTDEAVEFVKNLYDRELSEKKFERDWRDAVKQWLTYHSPYFSEELLRTARQVGDTGDYVTNQEELLALARVDWEKARPILDRLLNDSNQPVSQTLARWAFYSHAVKEKNSSDIEKYRRELQRTVENKNDKPGNRDLAMDALVEAGDFEGRDDWYLSLLEDETLYDLRVGGMTYTGLTTLLNHSPSDKYKGKMLELSRSSNAAVRSAAVRNLSTLLDEKDPEIVRAMLPWLEDPNWAKQTGTERQQLVVALNEFAMPESVPGLIAMLNEKQMQQVPLADYAANTMAMAANRMANSSSAVGNSTARLAPGMMTVDYYPHRDGAIGALAMQKDFRAVPALQTVLPQVEEWQRPNVVRALLASRGFSIPEQVEALELVAKDYRQPETYPGGNGDEMSSKLAAMNVNAVGNYPTGNPSYNPNDVKPLLGMQLIHQSDAEEQLVTALIERIGVLDTRDPQLALSLRRIMRNWNGAAVNRLLLRDLKNNKAETDAVIKLLSLRKNLRENQFGDVSDARGGTPTALGIAACLLENANEYDALLASDNTEAKAAMLACARLIRAALPVRKVAENLKSANKTLALAAERYLAAEDSPEARQIVLSLHPNEAVVLGARTFFAAGNSAATGGEYLPALFASVNESFPAESYYIFYDYAADLIAAEKRLQKEVKENQQLLGVYAYDNNFVRIYQERAVFSWQEDRARYRERVLEPEEFDILKNYLTAEQAGDLPPFLSECEGECTGKELLMLGRHGGRRVFTMSSPQPKFFAGLDRIFTEMRQPPAKLHYWLEKNLGGLEILFEDQNLQAEAVWKSGEDFRLLLNNAVRRKEIDKEIEQQEETDEQTEEPDYEKIEQVRRKRREQREYENYSWNRFADGKVVGVVEQPTGIEFLPRRDGTDIRPGSKQWKARTATFELRTGDGDGLYKIAGARAVKIRDGYFENPLVTTNGRWAVVTNYGEEEGTRLLRINLATNKQFPVAFGEYSLVEPVAYLPSLNRVLVFAGHYGEHEYETEEDLTARDGEFFLLDPETGQAQKAKGEIRPLAQQTYRPLQPTGNGADEFWAAIPDAKTGDTQIGVYNAKTLAFKSMAKIPNITFDSMRMWIDAGKIYFVYQGHLLGLPLPKQSNGRNS